MQNSHKIRNSSGALKYSECESYHSRDRISTRELIDATSNISVANLLKIWIKLTSGIYQTNISNPIIPSSIIVQFRYSEIFQNERIQLHDNNKSAQPNVNRGRARNVSFIHTKNGMMGGTNSLHFWSHTYHYRRQNFPFNTHKSTRV